VFEKLKEDADSFLLKSIKISTKKTYDSAWKRWSSFIQNHYSGVTDPTVENLASSQKLNLMIKFMSTVYDLGLRGDQITVLMSGVKQSLLLRGFDVEFMIGGRYQQAIKACRLTNQNLKDKTMFQIENSQLPITMEIIVYMRQSSWDKVDWSQRSSVLEAAAYLCYALAFDTGRRIVNFTHQDGKSGEDHCIRNGHITFKSNAMERV
jgi:hypothetical protein